jgi:hypothetical protein
MNTEASHSRDVGPQARFTHFSSDSVHRYRPRLRYAVLHKVPDADDIWHGLLYLIDS